MSEFSRLRYGFRLADTRFGDSLQSIASRELGDASRWTDLIAYNNLVPPFITDDPAAAVAGVHLAGRPLLVPAPSPAIDDASRTDDVFGTDVKLGKGGELLTDGVDFSLTTGPDNLVQALGCRIRTEHGDLMWHPEYGCDVRRMIGLANGPTKALLVAQFAKAAVQADPRVSRVASSVAQVAADAIRTDVIAETVAGNTVQASASV